MYFIGALLSINVKSGVVVGMEASGGVWVQKKDKKGVTIQGSCL